MRVCHSVNVSISKGAEPATNKRMFLTAALFSEASANIRTYSVGTPMNTVAFAMLAMARWGSNLAIQIILLPLISAP